MQCATKSKLITNVILTVPIAFDMKTFHRKIIFCVASPSEVISLEGKMVLTRVLFLLFLII